MIGDSEDPTLLVVGAAEHSLGRAILEEAETSEFLFYSVITAGINDEDTKLDVNNRAQIGEVLNDIRPDIVVCTVGVNEPVSVMENHFALKMMDQFRVNVLGPMEILQSFITSPQREDREGTIKKFIAISSNSARIPRTNSLAYCASKAALSMALRCTARDAARQNQGVHVWGYEPGLLAGTPMTRRTEAVHGDWYGFGDEVMSVPVLHRMEGVANEGIPVTDLARMVVRDVADFSSAMNGLLIPFDAGEL